MELVRGLDKTAYAITVAVFYPGGGFQQDVEAVEGVRLLSLDKGGRWDVARFFRRLIRAVYAFRPHIVHGYLGVANELALLVGRLAGARVVWGLRCSHIDYSCYESAALHRLVFRAGSWLSRLPDLIIVNSDAGKEHYRAHGYSGGRMVVIPNGIDVTRFRMDRGCGRQLRQAWGVKNDESLIGLMGRLDPIKDHATCFRAVAHVLSNQTKVRLVCVGEDGPPPYRQELKALAQDLALGDRVVWARATADMVAVYNALDVCVSSSFGEGFPNVIGEAMACGIPCVVTDVGDSAQIVRDRARIVPPRDPAALARALQALLHLPPEQRANIGRDGRDRIVNEYSLQQLAARTQDVLTSIL
jgi:glycosyltransferase involved in cell wall biosynthesis